MNGKHRRRPHVFESRDLCWQLCRICGRFWIANCHVALGRRHRA